MCTEFTFSYYLHIICTVQQLIDYLGLLTFDISKRSFVRKVLGHRKFNLIEMARTLEDKIEAVINFNEDNFNAENTFRI